MKAPANPTCRPRDGQLCFKDDLVFQISTEAECHSGRSVSQAAPHWKLIIIMPKPTSKQETQPTADSNSAVKRVGNSTSRKANPTAKKVANGESNSGPSTAAEKILGRIDALSSKIAELTTGQTIAQPESSHIDHLESTLERFMVGCRTDLSDRNADLVARVGDALSSQQDALSALTRSMQEIQETLAKSFSHGNAASSSGPSSAGTVTRDPLAERLDRALGETSENASKPKSTASTWEQIRTAFIQETSEPAPAAIIPVNAGTPSQHLPDESVDEVVPIENYTPPNTAGMNEDELRNALLYQERVIASLVGQLQKKFRSRQTLNAVQLKELKDSLPEETAARVEQSLKALDQQVRLGELELSLERARVSRQLSHLEETRHKLEANARVLGFTISADGQIEGRSGTAAQTGSKGRRWLGVMGFGN